MSLRFAVVHEAPADFTTATELADRVLLESIDWLEEDLLPSQREWIDQVPPGCALTWPAMKDYARKYGIRLHGHFGGEPGEPDAHAARRAIAYILRVLEDVDAILLIRDSDDQPERRSGLEQARKLFANGCAIVIGLAIREREAWVLSGFQSKDEDEQARLAVERQVLGFDPCEQSHLLTAGRDDRAPKSPKRVLRSLTDGKIERQCECWQSAPLELLRERGQHNGLVDYLAEVHNDLVPLLTGKNG